MGRHNGKGRRGGNTSRKRGRGRPASQDLPHDLNKLITRPVTAAAASQSDVTHNNAQVEPTDRPRREVTNLNGKCLVIIVGNPRGEKQIRRLLEAPAFSEQLKAALWNAAIDSWNPTTEEGHVRVFTTRNGGIIIEAVLPDGEKKPRRIVRGSAPEEYKPFKA